MKELVVGRKQRPVQNEPVRLTPALINTRRFDIMAALHGFNRSRMFDSLVEIAWGRFSTPELDAMLFERLHGEMEGEGEREVEG